MILTSLRVCGGNALVADMNGWLYITIDIIICQLSNRKTEKYLEWARDYACDMIRLRSVGRG